LFARPFIVNGKPERFLKCILTTVMGGIDREAEPFPDL